MRIMDNLLNAQCLQFFMLGIVLAGKLTTVRLWSRNL